MSYVRLAELTTDELRLAQRIAAGQRDAAYNASRDAIERAIRHLRSTGAIQSEAGLVWLGGGPEVERWVTELRGLAQEHRRRRRAVRR